MKRTFALMLACTMLFTMAIGTIAATDDVQYRVTEIYDVGYLLDEDDSYVDFNSPFDDTIPYGETVYFPLLSDNTDSGSGYVGVYESAAAKNIKIKTKWEEGSSYVDKISVIRKRFIGNIGSNVDLSASKYVYFLSVKIKARSTTTTSTNDVHGTIKLSKSGTYGFSYDDMQLDVNFEVGYTAPEDSNVIPIKPALFVPGEDFDEDDEETFDFEADSRSYFVVNTNSQKRVVLGMDTDYDEDIGDKYPNATLEFFNGNGGSFNRMGYLYLYAYDRGYVYQVQSNNTLKKISASYDAYEDAFVIRTRTLGRYVISDRKLNVSETNNTDDEDTTVIYDNDTQTNHNPGTGGYGFDDIAYGTAYTAPAVSQPSVNTTEFAPSSSTAPSSEASEETQTDAPMVIGTTKSVDTIAPLPATDSSTSVTPDVSNLNIRQWIMIICGIGAIVSAIGLLVCGLISFNKSRQIYY